jgi:biotin-dependent carboxylase-like uncharacterized protein
MIEVLTNSSLNIVVDQGRLGRLAQGISRGGALDRLAYELGNIMAGNDSGAASIEVNSYPFRLRFDRDCKIAVTGALSFYSVDNVRHVPWSAGVVTAGQTLTIPYPLSGRSTYIALSGGVDVPRVLGSRTTDIRASFGGFDGKALLRGDHLHVVCASTEPLDDAGFKAHISPLLTDFWRSHAQGKTILRVVPAAQWEEFSTSARAEFTTGQYAVTNDSNRQGYRLEGPTLDRDGGGELLSHGILPGTVQVPRNGQPIIQLVDANTCGGYPKIANVIDADLWKFGQLSPKDKITFEVVTIEDAVQALKESQAYKSELSRQYPTA